MSHASTAALRAAAFPAGEPLDDHGRRAVAGLAPIPAPAQCWSSPAPAARDTAAGLGLDAAVDPMLRDCDYGRWAGRPFADVLATEPDAAALWLQDPAVAPHGGEPMADLLQRVSAWLDDKMRSGGAILAVTHAAVLRAAVLHVLGAGWGAFRQIDVPPLCRLRLSGTGERWTLTALAPLPRLVPDSGSSL